MRLIRVWALGILVAPLLLSGCAFDGNVESVAQCVVATTDAQQAAAYGLCMGGTGELSLRKWDAIGCDGGLKLAFDSSSREKVAQAMARQLVSQLPFRRGLYASALGGGASQSQQTALADIGETLERFATRRTEAQQCLQIQPPVLDMMEQTELPLATAAVGSKAGVTSPELAQQIAQTLWKQAMLAQSTAPASPCDAESEGRFRNYATELNQFMEGKHLLAPGCRARMEGDGVSLVCQGAK